MTVAPSRWYIVSALFARKHNRRGYSKSVERKP
jgi:hypothetical protein